MANDIITWNNVKEKTGTHQVTWLLQKSMEIWGASARYPNTEDGRRHLELQSFVMGNPDSDMRDLVQVFLNQRPKNMIRQEIKPKKEIEIKTKFVNVYRTSCSGIGMNQICKELLISSGKMKLTDIEILQNTPRHRIEVIAENQVTTVDNRKIVEEINQLNRESAQKKKEIEIFEKPFTTIEKKLSSGIIPDVEKKEVLKHSKPDIIKPLILGAGILLLGISR